MADLARFPPSAAPQDLIDAVERHGVVVAEHLLAPDLLDRLNAELDPLLERAAPDHGKAFLNPTLSEFFGERTRHLTGVSAVSRVFATEILTHPLLLAVCDAFLLPGCARYQLNLAHVIDRGPGARRQWPHRDDEGWDVYLPCGHPELQVASVLALRDFTAGNGATLVVPGSHRWPDRARTATDAELVPAEMSAGSAVIYLGSTLHAGGANSTTDQWRRGMQVSYALGWLRTEENHFLTTPPDIARTLPRRSQELLGYAVHDAVERQGGALGHVDLREPVELLAEGAL
ncbi:phytanoyl-CoA dioxygenase family protein [Streptomyces varsoviensis]|uniref:phytanoyl-CoA dioxygenase family protein n=1 Tax=Streptomyces varsoviensis TaxID=67373 RepID=UPI0033C31F7D